jgi:enoyl-CoA hydratase
MEFLLCADLIPAQRAFEMGLLNAVVPREQLLDTAYEFARRMTANAPLAVQATKQSAIQGLYADELQITRVRDAVKALRDVLETVRTDDPATSGAALAVATDVLDGLAKDLRTAFEHEARISSRIFRTEDAKEGPRAFAEKRPPNWQAK